jgi:thiol peroxidase
MAQTKLGETPVNTSGNLPAVGSKLPEFVLTSADLTDVKLDQFSGKKLILNIFPSLDTGVCANSVREFNKRATTVADAVVLCISKDLPFAMKRFCGVEGINNVITASDFRNEGFSKNYGVEFIDGKLRGLCARAVIVADENKKISYVELVPVVGQEPNYEAAFNAL